MREGVAILRTPNYIPESTSVLSVIQTDAPRAIPAGRCH